MIKNTLKPSLAALLLVCAAPQIAAANQLHATALELANQKQFSQALQVLSQEDIALQSGYDHRFLKARLLAWDGQYVRAERELDALMSAYPDNPDLQLMRGNVAYYQGDLDTAEANYQTVLDRFPEYMDARDGLYNVSQARAAGVSSGRYTWRIDGGVGFSDLNQDGFSNWNDQFLRAEYVRDTLAYHGSVQRYDRFDTTNYELKAGVSDAVRGGWDWGVEAGFTPDALFRPDFSAGGRVARAIELPNGVTLYPNVTYRYDDYAAGAIHNLQPGVTAYLENEMELTGRLIGTFQDEASNEIGYLVQGRMPVTDQLSANIGYANAPETINGIAISTQSVFGGVSYRIQPDLDLHLNLARDSRDGSFNRNSVNVGFTHKR